MHHSRLPTELQESFFRRRRDRQWQRAEDFPSGAVFGRCAGTIQKTGKILCDHAVRWEIGMPVLLAVVYGRQPGGFIIKPIQLKNSRRKREGDLLCTAPPVPEAWPGSAPGTVAIPGGFPEHGIECLRRGALLLSVSQVNAPIAAAHLFHQVLTGRAVSSSCSSRAYPLRHPAQNARSRIHFDRAA